jgi:hypothetical protein
MHHRLHQPRGPMHALRFLAAELGGDLLVALGEPPPHLFRHPGDRTVAPPVRLLPADSQATG